MLNLHDVLDGVVDRHRHAAESADSNQFAQRVGAEPASDERRWIDAISCGVPDCAYITHAVRIPQSGPDVRLSTPEKAD